MKITDFFSGPWTAKNSEHAQSQRWQRPQRATSCTPHSPCHSLRPLGTTLFREAICGGDQAALSRAPSCSLFTFKVFMKGQSPVHRARHSVSVCPVEESLRSQSSVPGHLLIILSLQNIHGTQIYFSDRIFVWLDETLTNVGPTGQNHFATPKAELE